MENYGHGVVWQVKFLVDKEIRGKRGMVMVETMMKRVNLYELISSLTIACDLGSPRLGNHHLQVAYLAYHLGKEMNLAPEKLKAVMLAGLMHDLGALSYEERHELIENEPPHAHDHAYRGAHLIEQLPGFVEVAEIVRHHHVRWDYGRGSEFLGKEVHPLSHLLHLADRTVVQINKNKEVLGQAKRIVANVERQRNTIFVPEYLDVLHTVSAKESLWFDLVNPQLQQIIPQVVVFDTLDLNSDDMITITKIFAKVIDFRSSFTATHSAGVAHTAEKLAELIGFSKEERKMMLIAGYVHDLGKLAIKNDILEKKGNLNENEYNFIRSHTYYTYRLLQPIKAFGQINLWASTHHEKLNGNGYPFKLKDEEISLGSRIMTVADIFTAITEDRPYRNGMTYEEATAVLRQEVANGAICPYVVDVLMHHHDEITFIRKTAQQAFRTDYNQFLQYPGGLSRQQIYNFAKINGGKN